eukprot:COSAG05_NODE_464_length_9544_cov_2.541345_7_plen_376_part_00
MAREPPSPAARALLAAVGVRVGLAMGQTSTAVVGAHRFCFDAWAGAPVLARRLEQSTALNTACTTTEVRELLLRRTGATATFRFQSARPEAIDSSSVMSPTRVTIPGVGRVETHVLLDYAPLVKGRGTLGNSAAMGRHGAISAATPSNIDFGMLFTPPPSSLDNESDEDDGEDEDEDEEERRRLSFQPRPTPPAVPASIGRIGGASTFNGDDNNQLAQMLDKTRGPSPRVPHPPGARPDIPAREPAPAPASSDSDSSSDSDTSSGDSNELNGSRVGVTQVGPPGDGGVQPTPPMEQPPPIAAVRNLRQSPPGAAPRQQGLGGSTRRRFTVRGGGDFTIEPLVPQSPSHLPARGGVEMDGAEEVRTAADAREEPGL